MVDIREEVARGRIYARLVIEILGGPKEHIEKTMALVVKSLKEQDGVNVLKEKTAEAVEQGQLFSVYTEVEAIFKDFDTMTGVCFDYMPSSIEIIEPSDFRTKSLDMSNLFNDLLARMHEVDMRLKNTNAENIILKKNASALLRNIILLSLRDGKKSVDEVSKQVGIPASQLEPFMNVFVEQKNITKEGDKYAIVR